MSYFRSSSLSKLKIYFIFVNFRCFHWTVDVALQECLAADKMAAIQSIHAGSPCWKLIFHLFFNKTLLIMQNNTKNIKKKTIARGLHT